MRLELPSQYKDIFVGDTEMAHMMREHDWTKTSLGKPDAWPDTLKVAVRLLLTSKFEMWLGWGPDIAFFYNDAYRPTLGNKHPNALAVPTEILWAEIWEDIKERLATVYQTGQATWDRALLLILDRNGYHEETYHTFSYSPLIGDTGRVEGVFCAVTEETERVIGERRMTTMRKLASGLAAADTKQQVVSASRAALNENLNDIPFSALYIFDDEGIAKRQWVCGIPDEHTLFPPQISKDGSFWSLENAWELQTVEFADLSMSSDVPSGPWQKAPTQAAIIPLIAQSGAKSKGVLICGLNPHRAVSEEYLDFLKLIAGQITSRMASAEAFEAERRRAIVLAEAAEMREMAAIALEQINSQLSSEVELRVAERDRMRALFQQAPSFMCILSGVDHRFELVNDAYLQLVGNRQLVGLTVRDALPDLSGQGFFELLDTVYRSGTPYLGKNLPVFLQRDGGDTSDKRFINLIYQPIFDQTGNVTGIFVDGFDVTHQKRAEDELQKLNHTLEIKVEQRTSELATALVSLESEIVEREKVELALRHAQKMEALGNLTGGVAHDFNNLLQIVSGNLQLLTKDIDADTPAEQRLNNALAAVARGAKLASQLLAFGRRQPLDPKVINVRNLIQNIDDMLRQTLGEHIELETIVSDELWNTLIDPNQLENAILNLAINARDAMGSGGRLTIESANAVLDEDYAQMHDDVIAGQYVLVAVTDNGTGIPSEIIEHIVEPFYSTKSEGKGSGLGLSMVYGFLKQSGGHLRIYSEVGHGTTMKLYMPRSINVVESLPELDFNAAQGGTETVLVVEDDDGVRETSVALLSDLGYKVFKAHDAQSAFSVISSGHHIDLLFTDVVMPGPMRSTELVQKTKLLFPDMAILYTSGYTENSIVHGGKLDSGVELLSKPYTLDELAHKVRKVLSNAQQNKTGAETIKTQTLIAAKLNQPVISRILVVEDEPFILMSTVDMIGDLGHVVYEAVSAEDALVVMEAESIDILLTDVGLPGMSGTKLAQQVSQRWPSVRIIFASGDDRAKLASGIGDALQLLKPFTFDGLKAVLTEACPKRAGTPPVFNGVRQ